MFHFWVFRNEHIPSSICSSWWLIASTVLVLHSFQDVIPVCSKTHLFCSLWYQEFIPLCSSLQSSASVQVSVFLFHLSQLAVYAIQVSRKASKGSLLTSPDFHTYAGLLTNNHSRRLERRDELEIKGRKRLPTFLLLFSYLSDKVPHLLFAKSTVKTWFIFDLIQEEPPTLDILQRIEWTSPWVNAVPDILNPLTDALGFGAEKGQSSSKVWSHPSCFR